MKKSLDNFAGTREKDDLMIFKDEIDSVESNDNNCWKVLIVDDEVDVYQATMISLSDFVFEGRKLNLIGAHSYDDAKSKLTENPDIALIFLDVVLGEEKSGLDLVKYIRESLGNDCVRIVLRTGQPGQAPEDDIIVNYNIDDYKEKSSLTTQKLFTTVISSLRSYKLILQLDENNKILGEEISKRKDAEDKLQEANENLERKVEERTIELQKTNQKLEHEMIERQRMEVELVKVAKLESIGVLAGGIAHDFNNLLTGILGNLSLAVDSLEPEHDSISLYVDGAMQASRRAKDLTQQLLTFATGGAPVKKVINASRLIRESASFSLHGSNVTLEWSIANELGPIEADSGQIGQVIQNVIINANQAMPGGGKITISAENIDISEGNDMSLPPGEYSRITIKDKGIGIDEEHISKIFDPFFTTKDKGHGLGLATSFSIIKNHKGYMTLVSKKNEGATVYIYLPVTSEVFIDPMGAREIVDEISGKILIMDDEKYVAKVTANMLIKLGFTVETSFDGDQAVDAYRQAKDRDEPFDIVICDLTVPGGKGGVQTINELIEIDPEVNGIVASGYASDPILSNYKDYGFKGVISKPFDLDDLAAVVRRLLG